MPGCPPRHSGPRVALLFGLSIVLLVLSPGLPIRSAGSPAPPVAGPPTLLAAPSRTADAAGSGWAAPAAPGPEAVRPAYNLYYQYVGATTNGALRGFESGIGTTVVVRPTTVPCPAAGYVTFLRSSVEASSTTGAAANLGFFQENNSLSGGACLSGGPYPYYRDATGGFQVVCGNGALSDGPHTFNATYSGTSTLWNFSVDGSPIAGTTFDWSSGGCDGPSVNGVVDLGSALAELPGLWSAMKEESTSPTQSFWYLPSFLLPDAYSIRVGSSWHNDPVGVTTRSFTTSASPGFGVEGSYQNQSLGPDSIEVGSSIAWPSPESVLWAPPLVVRISVGPTTGTSPLVVRCTANLTGGTGSFNGLGWTFGDGTGANGSLVLHAFSGAGTYRVTASGSDSGGDVATSVPVNVTVVEGFSPPAAESNVPLLLESVAALVVGAGVGVAAWAWSRRKGPSG